MRKAVIYLADGAEECEALITADLLRRSGIEVTLAAVGESCSILGSHGIRIEADCLARDAGTDGADLLVLPGGMPGTLHLEADPAVQQAIRHFAQEGKRIAAICAAPGILGRLGLLQGRKATSYPGVQGDLRGAQVPEAEVVTDGNITTARSLGSAIPFALELIRLLEGEAVSQRIREAILYAH